MKKHHLFLLPVIALISSCADVAGPYRFTCTINGNIFEADEIPTVTLADNTISVEAFFEDSRFLLSADGTATALYTTGSNATGTIVYWPDKNNLTAFYSSDSAATPGSITISRITSTSAEGNFSGILRRAGYNMVISDGDFYGRRP